MRRRSVLGGLAAAGAVALGTRTVGSSVDARTAEALVAGSLQALAARVPGGAVEAHGSVAVRRLVVEGVRRPDAVALADPVLFDGISEEPVLFASNALVVAYRPDSPHAGAFRRDWRRALRSTSVGRTDPALDPLGYRTVMAVRLDDRLDGTVLEGMRVLPETTLLRNVEAGALDAAFVYRNMAVEHDLPFVRLPAEIDFSDPALAAQYRRASVDLGERTVTGSPIRYGAVALTERGRPWVDSLVGDAGRLRAAGFRVPAGYPRRVPVGAL